MATYFHGGAAATHQILNADGLQKLLLMNTAYSVEEDSATTTLFGCPAVDPASVFQPLPPLRRGLSLSLAPGQQRQICSAYMPESPERYGGTTQSLQRAVMGSRYLRATQQLLEEVVGVGGVVEETSARMPGRLGKGVGEDDACGKPAAELAAGERQELQMRKAKLVHLLDEVETRYKQYEDRMQAVAGSFEAVVGPGSARTYTALALRTISRRFRCLKDAICSQIRTAGRSLGEEECLQVGGGRPRLLSDHLVRQQRALQQLGMIQHSAWRPQRGLPERSVSVLRAWLFEHFLHPYPKDSDKHLLAKQTGLTRNQVSNWFINARVRLWKPMVEEMYMEEMKNRSAMNGDDDETGSPADGEEQHSPSKSTAPQPTFGTSTETEQSNCSSSKQNSPPAIAHYDDMLQMMQPSAKKPRSMLLPMEIMDMKPQDGTHVDPFMGFAESHHGYGAPNLFAPSSYPIDDVAGFSVDGVSLSLGLQRSSAQPAYLSDGFSIARRFEMAPDGGDYRNLGIGGSAALPQSAYESLEVQSRKGFAAQLLQDFVA